MTVFKLILLLMAIFGALFLVISLVDRRKQARLNIGDLWVNSVMSKGKSVDALLGDDQDWDTDRIIISDNELVPENKKFGSGIFTESDNAGEV